MFQELLSDYGDQPYGALAVVLAMHRAVAAMHQTNHWQATGPTAYSDHLLFQRLYETVDGFVDGLAERAVGMGGNELVNPILQAHQIDAIVDCCAGNTLDGITCSHHCEEMCKHTTVLARKHLEALGQLTDGIDNLLQGIIDKHEELLYLLKQRIS